MDKITGKEEWVEEEGGKRSWEEIHEDSTYECGLVIKIDCVGHVSKNFAAKVEALVNNGQKMSDGKSVNRGTNRLGLVHLLSYIPIIIIKIRLHYPVYSLKFIQSPITKTTNIGSSSATTKVVS